MEVGSWKLGVSKFIFPPFREGKEKESLRKKKSINFCFFQSAEIEAKNLEVERKKRIINSCQSELIRKIRNK